MVEIADGQRIYKALRYAELATNFREIGTVEVTAALELRKDIHKERCKRLEIE